MRPLFVRSVGASRAFLLAMAWAGALACGARQPEQEAAASEPALSREPVSFTAEEVEEILGHLPTAADAAPSEPSTLARRDPGQAGRALASTSSTAFPILIRPTKSLYFVAPDYMRVVQLNGRGE
ncbi:MAG TPA: hypothetical protein VLS93_11040, partial [Anaeromyxobacteraceae bacterium]|nr:hypothetical protein [Anaeromyxobacteraceae bacterium]